jgi:hypothetical protein
MALHGDPVTASMIFAGPSEFAKEVKVKEPTIRQWRHRGLLPEPDMVLSGMPVWTLRSIREWASQTGRDR